MLKTGQINQRQLDEAFSKAVGIARMFGIK